MSAADDSGTADSAAKVAGAGCRRRRPRQQLVALHEVPWPGDLSAWRYDLSDQAISTALHQADEPMIRAVATWLCRWAPPGRPWQLHLVLLLARRAAAAGTDVASLDAAELRRFLIDIGTDRQWNWPVAMTARSYYGGFFRHLERPDVVDQVGALPSTLCGGRIHETDLQRAVVAAIDSGASPTAAAKAYGVSRSAACRFYLQTTGELASVAHERHKQARRRELVARYDAGEPLEALADWWACSIGHVITVLRTEGRRPSRNG